MKEQDKTTDYRQAGKRRKKGRRASAITTALMLIASLLTLTAAPAAAQGSSRVVVEQGESIQAAIDAASPGTTIIVRGDHVENLWVDKSGISLIGQDATLTNDPTFTDAPCSPDPAAPASLICVTPVSPDGPPAPADYLNGFSIRGFTLSTTSGDAISTVFTNNVSVEDNTITESACDGVFIIFATGAYVERNEIANAGCAGINVSAGSLARVHRNSVDNSTFNGIAINDVSRTIVRRNITTNNCIGIGVVDGNDGGYGVREEPYPGDRLRVTANTSNDNNKTCPFGPDTTIGLTGIIVAGVDNVLIRNNTADNNASDAESLTAAGIIVVSLPNPDGSFSPTTNVTVIGNRAKGNSSAAGPLDLLIDSEDIRTVKWNHCDVSAPDTKWCD